MTRGARIKLTVQFAVRSELLATANLPGRRGQKMVRAVTDIRLFGRAAFFLPSAWKIGSTETGCCKRRSSGANLAVWPRLQHTFVMQATFGLARLARRVNQFISDATSE